MNVFSRVSLAIVALAFVSCEGDGGGSGIVSVPWTIPDSGDWNELPFGGEGSAQWREGVLYLDAGAALTGTQFSGPLPQLPYVLEVEARKMGGSDFFCGLTFPVSSADECLTFIVGGWGGGTVGISSIDGLDASQNETTTYRDFDPEQWYAIRVVVEDGHLSAFIDGEQVVDLATEGRKLGLRAGVIEGCAPLGLASWQTEAELRNIRWRSQAD